MEQYSKEDQALIDHVNADWDAASGWERLSRWFGLSRACFCIMPRVMMQNMPHEWQDKMARLLEEMDDAFPSGARVDLYAQAKEGGKLVKMPGWLMDYRHPDKEELAACRCYPGQPQSSGAQNG